jgi:hypothetical protein
MVEDKILEASLIAGWGDGNAQRSLLSPP